MGLRIGLHGYEDEKQNPERHQHLYDGEPQNFKDIIVILGCLNDLNRWPKSKEEPLSEQYVKVAEEIRDYLR